MEGKCSGNIIWSGPNSIISRKGDPSLPPPLLSDYIKSNMRKSKPYVIVGGSNSFSDPRAETLPAGQDISDGRSLKHCSNDVVAQFLLAVEPGAYLLCNAWDERFQRPLGLPLGDATLRGTAWTRKFASGVVASWDSKTKTGRIIWPSETASSVVAV